MARAEEGLPKMWVAHHALRLRRERPEWFGAGAAYTPLLAEGPKSDYVIAYLRGDSLAVIVPRLTVKLGGAWRETSIMLPKGRWLNLLTKLEIDGGRVAIKNLLNSFPVALLVRRDDNEGAG
jgi:(1->4)-alpha-D-glucan 1-alpha-D-glucosylmutase